METCLILGELEMGTDALLSAILSTVLRPSAQPSEFGRAAVTVADIEEVSDVPTLYTSAYRAVVPFEFYCPCSIIATGSRCL